VTRWRALAVGLSLAVVTLASVSVDCGRTFVVRDMQGVPAPGAYVAYHREGSTFAVVESLTYRASPDTLVRGDDAGRVVIPGAVHRHWPLVQTHPALTIDLIYAPTLHNGLASISRLGAVSRRGEFEVSADRDTVRLENLSADPFLWQGTLMNLGSLIGRLTYGTATDADTRRLTDDLIADFIGEYAALLERHGDTARPRPPMPASVRFGPERDQQSWREMIDKDLAERPRWRDELTRRFATEVRIYGARRQKSPRRRRRRAGYRGPSRSQRLPSRSRNTATLPYGSARGAVTKSTPAASMRA